MSRNYLEAFVIILIAAGLGFFIVLPKYSKLQEVKVSVAEKNAEIENRQEYFAELSQAAIELAQYEANMEKIETAFPKAVDAPALMNFVQAAAMQSGLVVKTVAFGGTTDKVTDKGKKVLAETAAPVHKLKTYEISGEFVGSYMSFKNFLARIEYSSRLISANTIAVTAENINDAAKKSDKKLGGPVDKEAEKKAQTDPNLNFKVKLSVNYYQ
jgi:Tfp pilus assembly protein PilO